MKKLYFLFLSLLVTSFASAQGNETFANFPSTTSSYVDGNFTGQDGSTWTFTQCRGDVQITDQSIMIGRNRTPQSEFYSGTISGGIGTISFNYMQAFSTNVNLNILVNDVVVGNVTSSSEQNVIKSSGTITVNQPGDVVIKFINANNSDGQVVVDDVVWTGYTGAATPNLVITSPTDSNVFSPGTASVTLSINVQNFVVADGTGDGHIHWTLDSGSGPLAQPMKYDTNDEDILVNNGGSYTVYMELVGNDHLPISPAVNATVSFSVADVTTVADITALIADVDTNGAGSYYQITGGSLVTHTDGYQNRKWIQDATISGVLIYDSAGTISTTYNVGDMVSGLTGYTEISNGVLRFIPTSDTGSIDSSGNAVVPQLVTISDLNANQDMYESELIELQNVSFVDGDGINVFSTGANYDVTDGSNTIIKRTDFFGADYIGELIPSGNIYSLTAISGEYNGTAQIYVRSLADFTLSNRNFEMASFNLYPNPTSTGSVNIVSTNSAPIQVKVFDILGKQVKNETINSTLNVSGLKSGIYILNITQEGHSVTKKLVID